MNIRKTLVFALFSLLVANSAHAVFPDDLDDVVFIEGADIGAFTRSMAVTANLSVEIGGSGFQGQPNVVLNSSKRNSWPAGSRSAQLSCCNANAWGFVKIGDIWYAGSWEFLRIGQTTKSLAAFVGPKHFRFSPLANFRPRNGEVYGFMVSGFTRNRLPNNIRERSNVAFYRLGVGPVSADEIRGGSTPTPPPPPEEEEAGAPIPAINLLLDD